MIITILYEKWAANTTNHLKPSEQVSTASALKLSGISVIDWDFSNEASMVQKKATSEIYTFDTKSRPEPSSNASSSAPSNESSSAIRCLNWCWGGLGVRKDSRASIWRGDKVKLIWFLELGEYLAGKQPVEKHNDLVCPICMEFYINPVPTSCGHTFCLRCI